MSDSQVVWLISTIAGGALLIRLGLQAIVEAIKGRKP